MAEHDQDESAVSIESISETILLLRGKKVMLSTHLASLYDVEPKVLVQGVKRNLERFPSDFMFQLTNQEFNNLKSQFVTSSWGGARRAPPYAFTQEGVAMLSSVLRSPRAVKVNIEIMRAFVRLRRILSSNQELEKKLDELDCKVSKNDAAIAEIIDAIRQLMSPPEPKGKRPIGFAPWRGD